MAYVIDPHLAFSDRLARLLRQREVPVKGCRVNDVWLAFVAATQAYLLWPGQRTAYNFMISHEDRQRGPVTVLGWTVYFEHVNRQGARTVVSYVKLAVETPLIMSFYQNQVELRSKNYIGLTEWLRAIQHNTLMKDVVSSNVIWKRSLSADFID